MYVLSIRFVIESRAYDIGAPTHDANAAVVGRRGVQSRHKVRNELCGFTKVSTDAGGLGEDLLYRWIVQWFELSLDTEVVIF